jgi:tRNA G18 (ribose-2'-O)-methylase SpoU
MTATLIPIEQADDPALEPYTAVRERDLAGREGLFVAEGEVVLRVLALRSRRRIRSLLLERRRVQPLMDVLEALPPSVAAFVVPQAVMDGVVGFSIHRGVLALGERGEEIAPSALARGAELLVGLVGLTNHDNVGSVFRNAAAFGASGLLLDASSCDPLYRKAIRVSAGAALVVPFARCASAEAMLDVLAAANVEAIALTPRADETIDALPPAPRALLLGTEGPGLPAHVVARARAVRIDMAPGLDSLNVAVASGIALHEARRALRRREEERGR